MLAQTRSRGGQARPTWTRSGSTGTSAPGRPSPKNSRRGTVGGAPAEPTVPNHDGAGVVDALGAGVAGFAVGDRVWVTLAGHGRPAGGTAQEFTVVPAERVFGLPAGAGFELGAS